MPKLKKEQPREIYVNADGEKLALHKSFVYEITFFRGGDKYFHLLDTQFRESKTYTALKSKTYKRGNVIISENIRLVAAPIEWLKENKYNLRS